MKIIPQLDEMDCGPACVAMISNHLGKNYPVQYIREQSYLTREGVSIQGIKEACSSIGIETESYLLSYEELVMLDDDCFPCILHWEQNHFVVLHKKIIHSKFLFQKKNKWGIADPAHGYIKLSEERFKQSWLTESNNGVALFLKATPEFFKKEPPKTEKIDTKHILNYLKPYKKSIFLLLLLLLIGSGLTLLFPFLTQNLIDKGVNAKNLNIITIILVAQLAVFFGSITIEIIRNWLMLFIGTKLSIKIISDFLKKLLQLPIKFFDTKMTGDLHQRIEDNERIENFLTSQSLLTFFSLINFTVFFVVLWYYDFKIILTYSLLTIVSLIWSSYWLKKRKILDYYSFQQRGKNQESIYEIINGVAEMKLNQFEEYKRTEWEDIQNKLFKINIRILKLDQIQLSGFEFINQIKNILVTFLGATLVVKGMMTLGELLAISYIIGQLNSPVNQLVGFFRSLQDAKLSMERLNEVQNQTPEEEMNQNQLSLNLGIGITLKNVSFQYEGPHSPFVLKDVSAIIPEGKITAIVGASGSGKTTLMKLLLRFYEPVKGNIFYNENDILNLSPKSIRENSGVVMQDGYIFTDTIDRNIATGEKVINKEKLKNAVKIANIEDFINSLPLGFNTKIGASGNGLSGGQKQRILIARAVYKNPHYIFFDEATSALDAENEKIIHDNLQGFFNGKTVIIIAHRLSTVKNADNIIVLKKGMIVEQGNHQQLVANKSEYFNLVRNQLELGN